MLVRPATEADLPAVLYLYETALEDPKTVSLEAATVLFRKMQTYPDYMLYLAETPAGVVGTFALLIMDNLGHFGTPSGVVEDVAVRPDQQVQGIGKRMMDFALERCREKGCYKLTLSSNLRRTEAHRFYESLGFMKHGFSFLMETQP
ncbi:MAG: GNAT family N-acetyltransferase [Sphingobacteriaceae bacterium]|nr:GNAT family N-acetyltransferase [Cytophagaceae bacterium]